MQPYLTGYSNDGDTAIISGAWTCPTVCAQASFTHGAIFQNKATHVHYSYWAGFSDWTKNLPPRPEDITDNELTARRLIMSDMVLWRESRGLLFNHSSGVSHAVWSDSSSRARWGQNPAELEGVNHLYGDGHVKWVTNEEMGVMDHLDSERRCGEHYY